METVLIFSFVKVLWPNICATEWRNLLMFSDYKKKQYDKTQFNESAIFDNI